MGIFDRLFDTFVGGAKHKEHYPKPLIAPVGYDPTQDPDGSQLAALVGRQAGGGVNVGGVEPAGVELVNEGIGLAEARIGGSTFLVGWRKKIGFAKDSLRRKIECTGNAHTNIVTWFITLIHQV